MIVVRRSNTLDPKNASVEKKPGQRQAHNQQRQRQRIHGKGDRDKEDVQERKDNRDRQRANIK